MKLTDQSAPAASATATGAYSRTPTITRTCCGFTVSNPH